MWVLIVFNLANGTMISVPGISNQSHCDEIGQQLTKYSDQKIFNLKYQCFKTAG